MRRERERKEREYEIFLLHLEKDSDCVFTWTQESHGLHHHDLYPFQHGNPHASNCCRGQLKDPPYIVSLERRKGLEMEISDTFQVVGDSPGWFLHQEKV